MTAEIEHICRRLEDEGTRMGAFFQQLGDEDWDQQVYLDGSAWRVREVLAHFVSAERTYLEHIQRLLQGGSGVGTDFDLNAFNASEVPRLRHVPIHELLAALRSARAASVQAVSRLQPADLDRRGRHPWLGDTDLRAVLKLLYRHPMIHLRDVRAALRTRRPVRPTDAPEGTEEADS